MIFPFYFSGLQIRKQHILYTFSGLQIRKQHILYTFMTRQSTID